MAELKVRKPSEEATESVEPVVVQDTRGRKFILSKPSVLAQFRLVDILGDTAKNETYMSMVLPLIWVTAIEEQGIEEPVLLPTSRRELDALIQRIDEPGIIAIASKLQEISEAETETQSVEALKNE